MNAKHTILLMNEVHAPKSFVAKMLEANGYLLSTPGDEIPDNDFTESPAVALFDLTLKNKDALEAMQRVHRCSPGTECILLSDQASRDVAVEAVKLGAYFYLQKPYEPEQLLLTIRRAIEKRQAAEACVENEERQRVLLDNVRDSILLCDRDGLLLSINRTAAEMVKSTPDALVGKTLNAVYPDAGDTHLERIRHVMDSGTSTEFESKRSLPAGGRKFLSTYHPLRNARGEIVAIQMVEYEITEREQMTRIAITAERFEKLLRDIEVKRAKK